MRRVTDVDPVVLILIAVVLGIAVAVDRGDPPIGA